MEKLTQYRQIIKQVLQHYMDIIKKCPDPNQETEIVLDEVGDHYLMHDIGWADTKRIWNTSVYVRIRNGKFYIEIDWLEQGIATDLLEKGVPKEDIVLAFHHPSVRPWTEFAVA
jgi:hypothetical protein